MTILLCLQSQTPVSFRRTGSLFKLTSSSTTLKLSNRPTPIRMETSGEAPTCTTVRVSTSVDINYAISILAVNLLEHNCKMVVKSLDVLTSKPCFAIMGTHVNWNLQSMTTELRAEIADFVQQGHSEGKWEKMVDFNN